MTPPQRRTTGQLSEPSGNEQADPPVDRELWDCDQCGYPLDNSGGCGCGRGANGGW